MEKDMIYNPYAELLPLPKLRWFKNLTSIDDVKPTLLQLRRLLFRWMQSDVILYLFLTK